MHDDRPSQNSLRDTLFRKIEHSKLMHFDISRYPTFNEGHPEKTYDFLVDMIKGYIARGKQERLLKERGRAVKVSSTSNKTTPALEDIEKPAPPVKTKKDAAAASSSSTDPPKGNPKAKAKSEAASVLPTPSPNAHADKKGKGKGKGGRSSSPVDKKKIYCNYFFNKGGCNKGDQCLYSHSQKVYDAKMKEKKGRSRSRDSSKGRGKGSSSSTGPKKKTVCWRWQKGKCTYGNKCRFLHADQSLSTASERSDKKTTRKKATPITIDSFFDSDTEDAMDYVSPRVASAKSTDGRKISFDMEPEVHKIFIKDYPSGMPKRIYHDPNKPYIYRRFEDLTDDQSKSDSALGLVRARARAIIMDTHGLHQDVDEVRIIIGPKFDMIVKLDEDVNELNIDEELVENTKRKHSSESPRISCVFLCQYKPRIEDSFSTLEADTT